MTLEYFYFLHEADSASADFVECDMCQMVGDELFLAAYDRVIDQSHFVRSSENLRMVNEKVGINDSNKYVYRCVTKVSMVRR